jgi:hypothetical protein
MAVYRCTSDRCDPEPLRQTFLGYMLLVDEQTLHFEFIARLFCHVLLAGHNIAGVALLHLQLIAVSSVGVTFELDGAVPAGSSRAWVLQWGVRWCGTVWLLFVLGDSLLCMPSRVLQ